MSAIKIEKVAAWRGPDGKLHENRDDCRLAVLREAVAREVTQAWTPGEEICLEQIINVVTNRFDAIARVVDAAMGAQ